MALPEGPTVLPFKSEKLSFSLAYKTDSAPTAQVELACVYFDRDAQVLDFVQFNRRAALNSSLKHSACSYLPPKDAVPGADEAIHMYPFDLSPQCEVMLLLASAPRSPFLRNDLGRSGKLQFKAHARELGGQAVQVLDVDLAPLAHLPARQLPGGAAAAGPLSNGHQTMVIAAVYTTPQGWTLSFDCSTFSEDHWGLLLPQMRKLLRRWPDLSAAAAAAAANPKLQQQVVVCSRKASDSTILQLVARTAPPAASTVAAASSQDGDASDDDVLDPRSAPRTPRDDAGAAADGEAAALSRSASADAAAPAPAPAPAAAAAAAADTAAAAAPDRLTLELGWDTFRPRIMLDDEDGEEEEEEPVVEFALAIYNLQGDEIATISIDNPEFEGVTVEEEPVQEESEGEEEEEPQSQESAGVLEGAVETEASAPAVAEGVGEAADAAEAAAVAAPGAAGSEAVSEGAAGEDAEDDGFVKEDTSASDEEKEETGEEKAARAAAAAETAAAAAQRAAANQRPLKERFPLKRRVHLTLPELPPDARALVLTMSSFGSGGFKNVKTLQARLLVALPQQQQAEETGEAAEEGEEEEEKPKKKKGPKRHERVLVHYRFDSVQGADAHLTQVLVLKLYKEYADSAFAAWAQHKVPDVASLFGGARAVEAAAAAAAGGSEVVPSGLGLGLSCEAAKTVLQEVLSARKQLEVELAERRARAEEEGLDEEEDTEYDLKMDRASWRVRVVGVSTGGESPEDLAPTISNLLAYDGDLDAAGDRTSPACKVAYPNRDTYFGPYAAGAKSGTGLYVAASGAAYAGQYAGGKRCGFGVMVLPDGGLYKGAFKDDKFDGQGSYLYPDKSLYTGGWKAGKKHGQGTYWDSAGGCLRGSWVSGSLKGQGQYDQPHYHFEGQFAKGLPAGPCSFSMSSDFRVSGLPQAAASYIIAPHGPTLTGQGKYELPPGAADEKGDGEAEEEAEAEAEGEEGSALPAWPKYEGLAYQSELQLPCGAADIAFPPPSAVVATI